MLVIYIAVISYSVRRCLASRGSKQALKVKIFQETRNNLFIFFNKFVENKERHNKLQNRYKNLETLGTQYTGNYVKIYGKESLCEVVIRRIMPAAIP